MGKLHLGNVLYVFTRVIKLDLPLSMKSSTLNTGIESYSATPRRVQDIYLKVLHMVNLSHICSPSRNKVMSHESPWDT